MNARRATLTERANAEAVKRRYSAYGTDGPAFVDGYLAAFKSIDATALARAEHDYGCLDCRVGFDGHVPPVQDAYRHRALVIKAHLLGEA